MVIMVKSNGKIMVNNGHLAEGSSEFHDTFEEAIRHCLACLVTGRLPERQELARSRPCCWKQADSLAQKTCLTLMHMSCEMHQISSNNIRYSETMQWSYLRDIYSGYHTAWIYLACQCTAACTCAWSQLMLCLRSLRCQVSGCDMLRPIWHMVQQALRVGTLMKQFSG